MIPNQGSYGFAQWATVIDPENPEIVVGKEFIIYNVDVAEPVVQQYNQIYIWKFFQNFSQRGVMSQLKEFCQWLNFLDVKKVPLLQISQKFFLFL